MNNNPIKNISPASGAVIGSAVGAIVIAISKLLIPKKVIIKKLKRKIDDDYTFSSTKKIYQRILEKIEPMPELKARMYIASIYSAEGAAAGALVGLFL